MTQLVLSLFPGIGLLDMAFEEEGFCVVRGPDLLWGGDIRRFHPPPGKFDGVIGGPPCQPFSRLRHLVEAKGYNPRHPDLIPEFARVVRESGPRWWLMENVPAAYAPINPCHELRLNNRWVGGVQHRERCFWSNLKLRPELVALEEPEAAHAVTADSRAVPVKLGGSGKLKRNYRVTTKAHRYYDPATGQPHGGKMTLAEMCRLQGLPEKFTDEMPFKVTDKRKVIGNGVPLPMGRAVARAVKRALGA